MKLIKNKAREAASRTAEDFYERTRGKDRIKGDYDEKQVIRYVDRVEVFPDRADVVFKGEIRVQCPLVRRKRRYPIGTA